MVSLNKKIEAMSADERSELAQRICRMIDSGVESVNGLRERWEVNEKLYRLEPYERLSATMEDASTFAFPLQREKIDAMVAFLATTLASSDQIFVYRQHGAASVNSEACEKTVHFLLRQADFERHLRMHLRLTAMNGKASYRLVFKTRARGMLADMEQAAGFQMPDITTNKLAYCGIDIRVIHLGDMVVYPVECETLLDARLVGHRFTLRKADIRAKQESGEYLRDVEEFSSVDRDSVISGRDAAWDLTSSDSGMEDDDEYVECYSVIVKLDLNEDGVEEYVEMQIAYDDKAILSIKPYAFDRPNYFCPALHQEYGKFYPAGSIAQNLQGLNLALNELMGMYYDGTVNAAFPPTLFNAEGGYQEGEFNMRPGQMIPTLGTPQMASIPTQFNPQVIPQMLQYLDSFAEQVTRTPRSSAQQPFRRGTTATEVSAIQQAAAVNNNDYLMEYASGEFCALADFVRQLAYENFEYLQAVYGDLLPAQEKEQLAPGGIWDVAVRAPNRTPMGRMQAMQLLLQLKMTTGTPYINDQELIKAMVMDSGLPNSDLIYISPDELAATQEQSALSQGNPFESGMAGLSGMVPPQGANPTEGFGDEISIDGGGGNMPFAGPGQAFTPVG